ncbi:MAG: amidohydrolase family protein [Actinomycetota bacterium]
MEDLLVRAASAWIRPGETIHHAAITASAGSLTYVGPTAAAPDARDVVRVDGVLMPAIADRHVHIGLADPTAVLLGGVTAVRDLGWPADRIFGLAEASELVTYNGPLIRAAGPFLTAPGGYPTRESYAPPGYAHAVADADEAGRAVSVLLSQGAAAIKVSLNAVDGPTPGDAELAEICRVAADANIPVTVHAQGAGQVERALGAGVQELAHAPFSERLSEQIVGALAGRVRIVSTLDLIRIHHGNDAVRIALDNLARFREAGGSIVYGTDMGPPEWGLPPGIDVREALLLRETGMDHDDVLGAMVRSPLEVGAPADLIAMATHPGERLEALAELTLVVRAGRVILRRERPRV